MDHKKTLFTNSALFFLGAVFVIFNVVFSQTVPELYFGVIEERRAAFVSYLQAIKDASFFNTELSRAENLFDAKIRNHVFADQMRRGETIIRLQKLLEKNPLSRDINYDLYVLYQKNGDTVRAEKYLKIALAVDPAVKSFR